MLPGFGEKQFVLHLFSVVSDRLSVIVQLLSAPFASSDAHQQAITTKLRTLAPAGRKELFDDLHGQHNGLRVSQRQKSIKLARLLILGANNHEPWAL